MPEVKNFSVTAETVIRDIRFVVEYRQEWGKTHLNFRMPFSGGSAGSVTSWPALPLNRTFIHNQVLGALSRRPKYLGKEFVDELMEDVWAWLEGISNQAFVVTPHFIAATETTEV